MGRDDSLVLHRAPSLSQTLARQAGERIGAVIAADIAPFIDLRRDIHRHPERHVAFAWDIHFCLGAWLARLEARVVLDTVFHRLPFLSLTTAEPRWKPMIFLRGLEALPLTWSGEGRTA